MRTRHPGISSDTAKAADSGSHRRIDLPPPAIAEANGDFLDPASVAAGATGHVPFDALMAPDTVVTLFLYGLLADGSTVNFQDVQQVFPSTPFPLVFRLPREPILQLEGRDLYLGYEVETFDGTGPHPSIERIYRVAAPDRLRAPIVDEARDGSLDPADVNAATGAHVRLQWLGMAESQRGTMTWTGSVTGGWTTTFTVRSVGPLIIPVPKDPLVTANVGGTVDVSYTVEGLGDSLVLLLKIGQAAIDLPAPTVDGTTSGFLDPATVNYGAVARLPASLELLPGDTVTLHFGGTDVYGTPPEFVIDALTIGRVLGTTVPVSYTLLRDGVSRTSAILSLRVGTFEQEDPDLPAPTIDQATSGALDLATFEGDAQISVRVWPLAAAGQVAWLEVHGIASGSLQVIRVLDGHTVTAEEAAYGLRRPLARAALEALDDGSTLTVKLWVNFAGSPYRQDAVLFPMQSYTLVKVPAIAPTITRVWGTQGDVPNDGSTRDTTLTVSGTGARGQKARVFDNSNVLGIADIGSDGSWSILAAGLSVGPHRFMATTLDDRPSNTWQVEVLSQLRLIGFRDYWGTFYPDGATASNNGPAPDGTWAPRGLLAVTPDGLGAQGPGRLVVWERFSDINGNIYERNTGQEGYYITNVNSDGSFQFGTIFERIGWGFAHVLPPQAIQIWVQDTYTGEVSNTISVHFRPVPNTSSAAGAGEDTGEPLETNALIGGRPMGLKPGKASEHPPAR